MSKSQSLGMLGVGKLTVAEGYPDENIWFGNQGTGTCASSRQCVRVCVVVDGHWWRRTFDKSDKDVDGSWSSSEAYQMVSILFS